MGAAYVECSAKESKGIHEVFDQAINTAIQAEEDSYEASPNTKGVKVKKVKKRRCAIL